jgi:hypothetical protein
MSCDKETLISIKNLFMSDWFAKPENRLVMYHYMQTFKSQRYELKGTPEKRSFLGKSFSDDCLEAFYKSNFLIFLKADTKYEQNL